MSNRKEFYKTLPSNALHEYAEKAGLGVQEPRDLEELLKIIGNRKRILEVGCGTGRLGKHLLSKDYIGLETNQNYIDVFLEGIKPEYRDNIRNVDFLDFESDRSFDAILFPWTVLWDFSYEEQKEAVRKSLSLVVDGGVVVIDLPAKEALYNKVEGYEPNIVYYDDLLDFLEGLDVSNFYKKGYKTRTGRLRDIIVLEK